MGDVVKVYVLHLCVGRTDSWGKGKGNFDIMKFIGSKSGICVLDVQDRFRSTEVYWKLTIIFLEVFIIMLLTLFRLIINLSRMIL